MFNYEGDECREDAISIMESSLKNVFLEQCAFRKNMERKDLDTCENVIGKQGENVPTSVQFSSVYYSTTDS